MPTPNNNSIRISPALKWVVVTLITIGGGFAVFVLNRIDRGDHRTTEAVSVMEEDFGNHTGDGHPTAMRTEMDLKVDAVAGQVQIVDEKVDELKEELEGFEDDFEGFRDEQREANARVLDKLDEIRNGP